MIISLTLPFTLTLTLTAEPADLAHAHNTSHVSQSHFPKSQNWLTDLKMLEKCLWWEICFTQLDVPRRQFVAIFAAVNILNLFTLFQLERMKMFELCEFTVDTNVGGCCASELHIIQKVQYTRVSQRNIHAWAFNRSVASLHAWCNGGQVLLVRMRNWFVYQEYSGQNNLSFIQMEPKVGSGRKKEKKSWSTAIRSYHLILGHIETL